ncbi:hypothetical protein METBIDRAFT_33621 [Metschnikowia bicuspidata var. bicuspidata NRRL YB-4993]|uniref:Uncharacterized protein n=1 Tax=Metschnikowia bicuspidata var. bicuspidata NRRL YB-4993 TaxID=869754 RepID=A0A1A0H4J3_9ASCO|nr:hypothetical protein METBIDRAFT_33621 [Metschnikowia bicuspidata var. bicuspidata NRRL YB-4993]OBA18994.1 hypothetical protein METBIDRAFT_33621 [Metschnikowia bicuspidata var. bicuspidata NRRL YB-4993]
MLNTKNDMMESPHPFLFESYKENLISTKAGNIHDISAFIAAFSDILTALTDDDSSEKRSVVGLDTMTIWFTRGLQLLKLDPRLLLRFCLPQLTAHLVHLFNYVCQVYESGNGPFSNAASGLLTKLLQFVNHVCLSDKNSPLTTQLTELIMSIPSTQKSFFNISEVFLKEVDDAVTALCGQYGSLPEKCMKMIRSPALANSVSKTFASFYTHLYNPKSDTQKYICAWSPLVERSLHTENERLNVINHLLPKLFRSCPSEFIGWVKSLNIETDSHEWRILMLPLLNCAYIISPKNDPVASKALTEKDLSSLLKHRDEVCRRDSLALVCSSVSATKGPPEYALNIFLDPLILNIFFKESTTAESRSDFHSLMRRVFLNCREFIITQEKRLSKKSDMMLERDVQSLKSRLQIIFGFISSQIVPDSSYSQLALSTDFLKFFVEYEFDGVQRGLKKDVKLRLNIFEIFTKELTGTLLRFVTNNYDDVRQKCSYVLCYCPIEIFELVYCEEIAENTMSLLSSLKGRQSDGGAQVIKTITQIYMKHGSDDSVFDCLHMVLSRMNTALESEFPIHGHFTAISEILALISPKFFELHSQKLSPIIASLLHTSLQMWHIIKPQMTLPASEIEEEYDSKAWRTVKENSFLLKNIMTLNASNKWNVLNQAVYLNICDILMEQLSSLSHRGTFSAIYPTFVKACELCYQTDLDDKPLLWLQTNLKLLETKEQLITRRSAGLPFLLTAILNSCITDRQKLQAFVEATFSELFRVAQIEYTPLEDEKNDLPQVHAFNCMRHIFRDSNLTNAALGYLEKALEISLINLDHSAWAIKNGAVMLFTVLQEKLFGSQKLGDLKSASLFFSKYSGLKSMLWNKLSESKNANDVFLVLSILLRLQAFSEHDNTLDSFVDIIIDKFLSHKVWKIREMAAKLLCMMTNIQNSSKIMKKLMTIESVSRNGLHGRLLCLRDFTESTRVSQMDKDRCVLLVEKWLMNAQLEHDWVNLRAALLIATNHVSIESCEVLKSYILNILSEERRTLDGPKRLFLEQAVTSVLQSCQDLEEVSHLSKQYASAGFYEAQIAVINYWKRNLKQFKKALDIHNVFFDLVNDNSTWDYVNTGCMELLVTSGVQILKSLNLMAKWTDSMKTLHVVLESRLALFDESYIIDSVAKFAVDELPEESRLHSVMACKNVLLDRETKRSNTAKLWYLIYEKLNDDSSDVRALASIDGMCAETSKATVLDRLVQDFSDESFEMIIKELENSINLNLRNLESERSNSLFEIERSNLFCNEVVIHRDFIKSLVRLVENEEKFHSRVQEAASRCILSVWKSVKANETLISTWTFNVHLDSAIRKVLHFEFLCSEKDQISIRELKKVLVKNQYFI